MLLGVQIHVIHQNTFARLSLVFLRVNGEKGERERDLIMCMQLPLFYKMTLFFNWALI